MQKTRPRPSFFSWEICNKKYEWYMADIVIICKYIIFIIVYIFSTNMYIYICLYSHTIYIYIQYTPESSRVGKFESLPKDQCYRPCKTFAPPPGLVEARNPPHVPWQWPTDKGAVQKLQEF